MTSGGGPPSPKMAAAMAGAVDLAAVKARSEAAARAAQAPAPDPASSVVEVSESAFQSEVLDRSFQLPVIIDVRSERSEASTQLTPILERLASAAGGQWVLAKVDIDANPRIAQALQVQSVPTVFAVIGGQLVPGFAGLLPEAQIREFVDAVLEAAGSAGLTGAPTGGPDDLEPTESEAPGDPRFLAAEDALQAGDYALATDRYRAILAAEPANAEAALALRQTEFMTRVDQPGLSLEASIAAAADRPDDLSAQLAGADAEIAGNDIDAAFARLLGLIRRLPAAERGPVRDRLVEYFDLLGSDDPRVAKARRDLANALF